MAATDEEVFKEIVGYPGYAISNLGNVKNTRTGLVLKPGVSPHGYLKVTLYKDGKRINHSIHRLAANAFIANADNKRCVDHIDGCVTNNRIENLRWATDSENRHNARAYGALEVKGVYKNGKGFRVQMYVGGIHKGFGTYATLEEARVVSEAKRREIHGEYARI
jgi:hypothetical protein